MDNISNDDFNFLNKLKFDINRFKSFNPKSKKDLNLFLFKSVEMVEKFEVEKENTEIIDFSKNEEEGFFVGSFLSFPLITASALVGLSVLFFNEVKAVDFSKIKFDYKEMLRGGGGVSIDVSTPEGPAFEQFREYIKRYEAGKRGYNSSWADWGENTDFVNLTISQVIIKQKSALSSNPKCVYWNKENKRYEKSSAVGFYQFTSETIETMVRNGVVSLNDKFSPENQDKMALWLIKHREKMGGVWAGLKENLSPEFLSNLRKNILEETNTTDFIEFGDAGSLRDQLHFNSLNPSFKSKIINLAQIYFKKTGKKLKINSSWRSREEQMKEYKAGNGSFVSKHEYGLAVDLNSDEVRVLESDIKELGLQHLKGKEYHHVQEIGLSVKKENEPSKKMENVSKEVKPPISKKKKIVKTLSKVPLVKKRPKITTNNNNYTDEYIRVVINEQPSLINII